MCREVWDGQTVGRRRLNCHLTAACQTETGGAPLLDGTPYPPAKGKRALIQMRSSAPREIQFRGPRQIWEIHHAHNPTRRSCTRKLKLQQPPENHSPSASYKRAAVGRAVSFLHICTQYVQTCIDTVDPARTCSRPGVVYMVFLRGESCMASILSTEGQALWRMRRCHLCNHRERCRRGLGDFGNISKPGILDSGETMITRLAHQFLGQKKPAEIRSLMRAAEAANLGQLTKA